MKRYISAMSTDRNRAKYTLSSYSGIILEHIIKLLVYSDIRPNDVDGWISTIANWIHRADSITLKPKAKKLSKGDLLNTLFNYMGDEVKDYKFLLYAFIAENLTGKLSYSDKEPYPEFEVTYELAEDLMNICYDIMDATLPLLIDKQDHTMSEYKSAIQPIFDQLK